MKSTILLWFLCFHYSVAQLSRNRGSLARSSRRQSTHTGQMNLGTTEDGQEGYLGAMGGQGAFPFFGGAGAGNSYADGGVLYGIHLGYGSGSIQAYYERLRAGIRDQLPHIHRGPTGLNPAEFAPNRMGFSDGFLGSVVGNPRSHAGFPRDASRSRSLSPFPGPSIASFPSGGFPLEHSPGLEHIPGLFAPSPRHGFRPPYML